ncbi:hypothetical protein BaRGS_00008378, partial [Batillaria attramentaria]
MYKQKRLTIIFFTGSTLLIAGDDQASLGADPTTGFITTSQVPLGIQSQLDATSITTTTQRADTATQRAATNNPTPVYSSMGDVPDSTNLIDSMQNSLRSFLSFDSSMHVSLSENSVHGMSEFTTKDVPAGLITQPADLATQSVTLQSSSKFPTSPTQDLPVGSPATESFSSKLAESESVTDEPLRTSKRAEQLSTDLLSPSEVEASSTPQQQSETPKSSAVEETTSDVDSRTTQLSSRLDTASGSPAPDSSLPGQLGVSSSLAVTFAPNEDETSVVSVESSQGQGHDLVSSTSREEPASTLTVMLVSSLLEASSEPHASSSAVSSSVIADTTESVSSYVDLDTNIKVSLTQSTVASSSSEELLPTSTFQPTMLSSEVKRESLGLNSVLLHTSESASEMVSAFSTPAPSSVEMERVSSSFENMLESTSQALDLSTSFASLITPTPVSNSDGESLSVSSLSSELHLTPSQSATREAFSSDKIDSLTDYSTRKVNESFHMSATSLVEETGTSDEITLGTAIASSIIQSVSDEKAPATDLLGPATKVTRFITSYSDELVSGQVSSSSDISDLHVSVISMSDVSMQSLVPEPMTSVPFVISSSFQTTAMESKSSDAVEPTPPTFSSVDPLVSPSNHLTTTTAPEVSSAIMSSGLQDVSSSPVGSVLTSPMVTAGLYTDTTNLFSGLSESVSGETLSSSMVLFSTTDVTQVINSVDLSSQADSLTVLESLPVMTSYTISGDGSGADFSPTVSVSGVVSSSLTFTQEPANNSSGVFDVQTTLATSDSIPLTSSAMSSPFSETTTSESAPSMSLSVPSLYPSMLTSTLLSESFLSAFSDSSLLFATDLSVSSISDMSSMPPITLSAVSDVSDLLPVTPSVSSLFDMSSMPPVTPSELSDMSDLLPVTPSVSSLFDMSSMPPVILSNVSDASDLLPVTPSASSLFDITSVPPVTPSNVSDASDMLPVTPSVSSLSDISSMPPVTPSELSDMSDLLPVTPSVSSLFDMSSMPPVTSSNVSDVSDLLPVTPSASSLFDITSVPPVTPSNVSDASDVLPVTLSVSSIFDMSSMPPVTSSNVSDVSDLLPVTLSVSSLFDLSSVPPVTPSELSASYLSHFTSDVSMEFTSVSEFTSVPPVTDLSSVSEFVSALSTTDQSVSTLSVYASMPLMTDMSSGSESTRTPPLQSLSTISTSSTEVPLVSSASMFTSTTTMVQSFVSSTAELTSMYEVSEFSSSFVSGFLDNSQHSSTLSYVTDKSPVTDGSVSGVSEVTSMLPTTDVSVNITFVTPSMTLPVEVSSSASYVIHSTPVFTDISMEVTISPSFSSVSFDRNVSATLSFTTGEFTSIADMNVTSKTTELTSMVPDMNVSSEVASAYVTSTTDSFSLSMTSVSEIYHAESTSAVSSFSSANYTDSSSGGTFPTPTSISPPYPTASLLETSATDTSFSSASETTTAGVSIVSSSDNGTQEVSLPSVPPTFLLSASSDVGEVTESFVTSVSQTVPPELTSLTPSVPVTQTLFASTFVSMPVSPEASMSASFDQTSVFSSSESPESMLPVFSMSSGSESIYATDIFATVTLMPSETRSVSTFPNTTFESSQIGFYSSSSSNISSETLTSFAVTSSLNVTAGVFTSSFSSQSVQLPETDVSESTVSMQSTQFFDLSQFTSVLSFTTAVPEFSPSGSVFSTLLVSQSSEAPPMVTVPSQSATPEATATTEVPPTFTVPSQSVTPEVSSSSEVLPTVSVPSQSLVTEVLTSSGVLPPVVVPTQTLSEGLTTASSAVVSSLFSETLPLLSTVSALSPSFTSASPELTDLPVSSSPSVVPEITVSSEESSITGITTIPLVPSASVVFTSDLLLTTEFSSPLETASQTGSLEFTLLPTSNVSEVVTTSPSSQFLLTTELFLSSLTPSVTASSSAEVQQTQSVDSTFLSTELTSESGVLSSVETPSSSTVSEVVKFPVPSLSETTLTSVMDSLFFTSSVPSFYTSSVAATTDSLVSLTESFSGSLPSEPSTTAPTSSIAETSAATSVLSMVSEVSQEPSFSITLTSFSTLPVETSVTEAAPVSSGLPTSLPEMSSVLLTVSVPTETVTSASETAPVSMETIISELQTLSFFTSEITPETTSSTAESSSTSVELSPTAVFPGTSLSSAQLSDTVSLTQPFSSLTTSVQQSTSPSVTSSLEESSSPPVSASSTLTEVASSTVPPVTTSTAAPPVSTVTPEQATPSTPSTTPDPSHLVVTVIRLLTDDDINSPSFINEMEQGLAKAYDIALQRKESGLSSRRKRFAVFIEKLSGGLDVANVRHRRAVSGSVEVKITDTKVQADNPSNAELTYTVAENGQVVPATQASETLNTLQDQEVALELNRVVVTIAKPVQEVALPQEEEDKKLWIIGAVLGPALLIVVIWIVVCLVVRHSQQKKDKVQDGTSEPHLLTVKHDGDETAVTEDPESSQLTGGQSNGLLKSSPRRMTYEVNPDPDASDSKPSTLKKGKKSPKKKKDPPVANGGVEGESMEATVDENTTPAKRKTGKKSSFREPEEVEMNSLDPGFYNSQMMQSTSVHSQLYSQPTFENQCSLAAEAEPQVDSAQAAYERAQKEIDKVLGPRETNAVPDVLAGNNEKKRSKRRSKKGQVNEGFTDEHDTSGTSTQPPAPAEAQETLDEVRSRVHALLDDAFSLISNSYSSIG